MIMTDFVWDIQSANGRGHGETPFQCMQTLAGMVTFGSNIPLFTLALPKVECIAFPGDQLTPPVREAARWVNFYDPADVLGWPLKPLSDAYAAAVNEDRAIRVGGLLTFWNPASHGGVLDWHKLHESYRRVNRGDRQKCGDSWRVGPQMAGKLKVFTIFSLT